ncbi:MAG: hypothetical protein SPF09_01015 [Bacteroidaceae bacterium]|nr:hypothetical protein [Bacteroidaceae bacterium]
MLQKEFEDRIGRSVSEQEYLDANYMYENAGDMDKDEFCREWLKIGNSRLVKCLAEKIYLLNKYLQEKDKRQNELREIISNDADSILEIENLVLKGETTERITKLLDHQVWLMIGAKELILRKINMDMDLSEFEKNYIKEYIK